MTSVEPGASVATCRSVAEMASLVRYMLDPGRRHDARLGRVEARRGQALPPVVSSLEVDGHEPQVRQGRRGRARRGVGVSTPAGPADRSRTRASREASSGRRCAKVSNPAPRMTYCSTPRATRSATRSSTKRARARMEARKGRVNGLMSGRLCQPSSGATSFNADVIDEHVRRRIGFHVQRSPQSDPHRRVLRAYSLINHDASLGWERTRIQRQGTSRASLRRGTRVRAARVQPCPRQLAPRESPSFRVKTWVPGARRRFRTMQRSIGRQ